MTSPVPKLWTTIIKSSKHGHISVDFEVDFALYYVKESNLLRKLRVGLGKFLQFAIDIITANLVVSNPPRKKSHVCDFVCVLCGYAMSRKRKLKKAEARSLTRNN